MVLCSCRPNAIFGAVLLAVVLLPAQYLLPDLKVQKEQEKETIDREVPVIDLFIAGIIVIMVVVINSVEWVQKRTVEKKISKLNGYLNLSVASLKAMDAQQEELEATLKMVHNTTSEYNLLLYLLLKEQKIFLQNDSSNSFNTLDGVTDRLTF